MALDRWGRVLLRRRDYDDNLSVGPGRDCWELPGVVMGPFESPDEAAIRGFEENTDHLLDQVRLFRVYRRATDLPSALVDVQHVYYDDPDLDVANIACQEGQEFRYFAVEALPLAEMAPPHRVIVEDFVNGTAYRALFH